MNYPTSFYDPEKDLELFTATIFFPDEIKNRFKGTGLIIYEKQFDHPFDPLAGMRNNCNTCS